MKYVLFTAICLLSFVNSLSAQTTETFDIATFQPPTGWAKKAGPDGIQFSAEDKSSGGFTLITMFRSIPALANSKENFDAAW